MATVINSPLEARTDTARHLTSEPPADVIVTGTGPTSLFAGNAGRALRSLMAIQTTPDVSTP